MKLKDMEKISTKLAAEILNRSEQFVRVGLQQERLPIGCAIKKSSQWTYLISYEMLKNFVGEEKIRQYEENHLIAN